VVVVVVGGHGGGIFLAEKAYLLPIATTIDLRRKPYST
jgi:hypothetical protein